MQLRTKKLQKKYNLELNKWENKCYLCETKDGLRLKDCIIKNNDFPYDKKAEYHEIIFNKEHDKKLQVDLTKFYDFYDIIFQNKKSACSIKEHPHYHLIRFKDDIDKKEAVKNIKKNSIIYYINYARI